VIFGIKFRNTYLGNCFLLWSFAYEISFQVKPQIVLVQKINPDIVGYVITKIQI